MEVVASLVKREGGQRRASVTHTGGWRNYDRRTCNLSSAWWVYCRMRVAGGEYSAEVRGEEES